MWAGPKKVMGRFMLTFNYTNEKGTAIVELAILLPLLMILLFGIIEFGRALYQEQMVTKSALSASRYLSRVYDGLDSNCLPNPHWPEHEAAARTLAVYGKESRPLIPTMSLDDVNIEVMSKTLPPPANAVCVVRVSVVTPFNGLFTGSMVPFTTIAPVRLNSAVDAVYIGE